MQLALRERKRLGALLALWVLLTVLCALTGPFGTHDGLGLGARAAYWSVIVAASIAGSRLITLYRPKLLLGHVLIWMAFAVLLTSLVFGLNALVFPATSQSGSLWYLLGVVGASVLVINGMLYLAFSTLSSKDAKTDVSPDPQARFLRRLPIEARGPLVRIEAQDHYLNVITTKGNAMILLRLAEAVEELEGAGGLQTHRSHWIMLDAVQGHRRTAGRDVLQMSDGASVPVARTRREAARDAGLF